MTTSIPDAQSRQSALDITQSFLVQAPAGSGKTELLTQRFLKLLSFVDSPEEIIAITFTNKAAEEMRSRIIGALIKSKTSVEPDSEHEKTTWQLARSVLAQSKKKHWHLEEHPNRLKILTLDALSLQIAQKLPISSKLGAQLDISDDPDSLYRQAAKTIILSPPKNAPWLQDIESLLLYLDNNYLKLETLFADLLAKRDQWLPLMMFDKNNHNKMTYLENELAHINEYALRSGINLLPQPIKNEINALAIYASATINSFGISTNTTESSQKEYWLAIANMLLTQNNQLRKRADKNIGFPSASSSKNKQEKQLFEEYKNRYQSLMNTLETYPDFTNWLIEIRELPNTKYSEQQYTILSALLTLLPLTVAQLRLIFSQTGNTDYIENAQSALYALGDPEQPTNLSLQLDYSIKHLLIDEFQDTSNNQFQLIEKLTAGWMPNDGRTLFLVGDPMQSIYRFRQAEVGLFLHAKHHGIGQISLNFIALNSNFRSSAQIVNWINENFKNILPKKEDIALGAIPYSIAYPIHQEQENSHVICSYFSKNDMLSEEMYIVENIKKIRQTAPNDSIAILIRSRDHLKNITPLLQSANLEYQAIDIETLSHKSIIQDLLSLTRAYIHLADRIAWLACLRAPWCGLNLDSLWQICHQSDKKTIWMLINDESLIAKLCPDSQQRLLHFRQVMSIALQQRQRCSLRDNIEKIWRNLNAERLLEHQDEIKDIEQFFNVLDKITDATGTVYLNKLEKKVNALFAATTPAQTNPIQIMTIHKSKGLEFDHVFLPKLEKKPAPPNQPLIVWLEYPDDDNYHHLLMAPLSEINLSDSTYRYIQKQQQQKLLLEIDRLLYVAATRAKNCLYLTASLDVDKPTPSTNSLLGRAWKTLGKNYTIIKTDPSIHAKTNAEHINKTCLKRLALDELNTSLKAEPYSYEQKNLPSLELSQHKNEAKLGVIIHLIIERVAEYGIDWWQSLNDLEQQKIIRALMQQFNLDEHYKKISLAISHLIQDPRGQWILKKRDFSFSEYTVYYHEDSSWAKKIMDRVFCDDQGDYWIIDFKTSENIQYSTIEYAEQLKSYQQALTSIIGNKKIHLALYFILQSAWYIYPS